MSLDKESLSASWPTVALTHSESYAYASVQAALGEALTLALPGGLASLVKPGHLVALKVNMLMGKEPGRAITTHPALVSAVCHEVARCGGQALIIDSPGGPYTHAWLKKAYEKCGFAQVAADTGASLNYDLSLTKVTNMVGGQAVSAELLAPAVAADVIINLPKLKTHGLTTMTCAVKNMFGLIPGLTKIEYHLRAPKIDDFCRSLVAIAEMAAPELTIVDAIQAMEGEGPSGGTPRNLGYLIVSSNMHAVDLVAAKLMGLPAKEVPTIVAAREMLGADKVPADLDQISLQGAELLAQDLRLPIATKRVNLLDNFLPRALSDHLGNYLRPKPLFSRALCTSCGLCVRSCPPVALTIEKGATPRLDLSKCIRCFCCQELCPEQAVDVQRNWLGKMLMKY